MKKMIRFSLGFMFSLMLLFSINAAVAAEGVNISLQINNEMVTINGEEIEVVKPYLSNNVTLVPLRVISTGFAANIGWSSKTQTVRIQYGDEKIQLVIGSKTAVINEEFVELQTAPELINGTTMVPLRFITQSFGALIDYEPDTKKIAITSNPGLQNSKELEEESGSTDIVSGQNGKTYIGDSHYGWTIKYPTFLSLNGQSDMGDWVGFRDADGNYNFTISIEPAEANLNTKTLLDRLSQEVYESETVLDKKIVSEDITYARILTKGDTVFYDHRAYMNDGKVYIVIMSFYEAQNFYKAEVQEQYQELLNSFVTSFDKDDSTVQDISVIEDGYRIFKHEDYGLSFKIPAEWETSASRDYFYNADETIYLQYDLSSIQGGEGLEEWLGQIDRRFMEMVLPEYLTITKTETIMVGDLEVLTNQTSIRQGDTTLMSTDLLFFKGKHKYSFSIGYPAEMDISERNLLIDTIVQSISVDTETLPYQLGYIEDEMIYDLSLTKTYLGEDGNYSVEVPDYWEYSMDSWGMEATYMGGEFSIAVLPHMSKQQIIEIYNGVFDNSNTVSVSEIKERSTIVMNNLITEYIVAAYQLDDMTYEQTTYVFEKDDVAYIISYKIGEIFATPENMDRLEEAVRSFKLLK